MQLGNIIALAGLVALGYYVPEAALAFVGLFLSLAIFALLSVFFKELLKHDPNNERWYQFFLEVQLHHASIIQKGGKPTHILRGGAIPKRDEKRQLQTPVDNDDLADGYRRDNPAQNGNGQPVQSSALFGLWMLYKSYVMKVTGYHVYVPFFYGPSTYRLPRYRVREEEGKKIYEAFEDTSNHIRNELFTWYFEFTGAEIEKIPFVIKGSSQVRIRRFREGAALFKTDSWNVLLDQALNSVVRAIVRRDLNLRDVIGGVDNTLWDDDRTEREDIYHEVAKKILVSLLSYKIGAKDEDGDMQIDEDSKSVTLADLGIDIERIDILDFEDELSEEERVQLRAAVLKKEEAKGKVLDGKAEAANVAAIGGEEAKIITKKGTATAGAQRKLAEVHAENPELGGLLAQADTLRAFAEKGSLVDAVATAFLGKPKG